MSNPSPQLATAATRGGVPRALWIGGGVLGLATAALVGALITRSMDAAAAPAPASEAAASAAVTATAGKATPPARKTPAATAAVPACPNCGTVESVSAVEQEGQGSGLGAVAGGVAGGLLGNQFGSGKGRTAMTLLGAVGGGLAGNQVEKKVRSETVYNVSVRMHDGSVGTFRQTQPFAVGTKVVVDGKTLRMASNAAGQDSK